MKITQEKIAKETGFSQTAVSMVLNNGEDSTITEKTRNKILHTAEELGYKKRFIQLPANLKTGNIGYLIPASKPEKFLNDPYYHRLVEGITAESEENRCNIVIYSRNKSFLPEIIFNRNLDGLIIETIFPVESVEKLQRNLPIILLNWRLPELEVDCVMPDNVSGSKKAVSHLASLGHKRIALLGMKPLGIHAEERVKGYFEGLRTCSLKEIPEFIQLPESKAGGIKEAGEVVAETLKLWLSLPDRPTAVVATGDVYALPLLKAAHKMGLSLPEDLSVIGCDDTIACLYSHPSLTSLNQPLEEMAKKSLRLLLERVETPEKPIESLTLDVKLAIRDSACKL